MVETVSENELHAYVDGGLDAEQRLAVEAWLAEMPEAALRVADYRSQNDALHDLFDPVLAEALPEPLAALGQRLAGRLPANGNLRHAGRWTRVLLMPQARVAAAVVLMIGAGALGWGLHDTTPVPVPEAGPGPSLQTFAEEAVQAHAFYTTENRSPVEMGADDRGALDNWVSQRLGQSIVGPDLSSVGYHLVSGRLMPTATGTGAQYMYDNDQHHRLTLFVGTPNAGQDAAFSFVQQGDTAMVYWIEGSLGYALIGKLGRDELMTITKAVYHELKARPPAPVVAQPAPPPAPAPQPANPVQPASDHKSKQM